MNEMLMYFVSGAFMFFVIQFAILTKKLVDSE